MKDAIKMLLECSVIIRKNNTSTREYNVGRRAYLLAKKLERKCERIKKKENEQHYPY